MNMDVSIIIVNYNTCRMTAECIDSVFEKTHGIDFEIILVDNASTDGSREHFAGDGRITYIYNDENLGFGRANNAGIERARGRYVFLLNSDTLLIGNAIKTLCDHLDAHPETGACGGNLFYGDRTPAQSFMRYFPSVFWELNTLCCNLPARLRYGRNATHNHTGRVLDVAYVTGADLMLRRDLLQHIGAFDPRFFMYYEETELCHRIRRAGFRIQSVPAAEIIHLESKSFSGAAASERKIGMMMKSRALYYELTHSRRYGRAVDAIWNVTIRTRLLCFARNEARRAVWEANRRATARARD